MNLMKKNKAKSRVTSIQYIHDPESAKKWMELFMELTEQQFIDHCLNKDSTNQESLEEVE